MTTLMPMLETIDMPITFFQKRDVYICHFMVALKIYEGQLHSLYTHKGIAFAFDVFWAFCNLLDCSHEQVHMKWVADLNDNSANLAIVANGEKIWAMWQGQLVDCQSFAQVLSFVKEDCICMCSILSCSL